LKSWEVSREESGQKLLAFLKQKTGDQYSSRQLKKAIEESLCQINGRTERFATRVLGSGDKIAFQEPTTDTKNVVPLFEEKRILFEDSDLLIYDKPSNTSSDDPDFLKAIQGKRTTLRLTHRLDRDTTGVLIFAKSQNAEMKVLDFFKKRMVNKTYLALVDGNIKQSHGCIDNYLGIKNRYQGQSIWGSVAKSKGSHAITGWECLQSGNDAALVCCKPKTGRTHQIRVHMSEMGHPILGDFQYGRSFHCQYRAPRYLLHALSIELSHPSTGEPLFIASSIPQDFQEALTFFGFYYEISHR